MVSVHPDELKYSCTFCALAFWTVNAMRSHMTICRGRAKMTTSPTSYWLWISKQKEEPGYDGKRLAILKNLAKTDQAERKHHEFYPVMPGQKRLRSDDDVPEDSAESVCTTSSSDSE